VLDAHVLYVDEFGNVKLSALGGDLNAALPGLRPGEPVLVRVGDGSDARTHRATWAVTFGSVPRGAPLLYLDSFGRTCLAVNQGSAAAQLGLTTDSPLSIARDTR
jgi:S-adenosylmethionine hydrolase